MWLTGGHLPCVGGQTNSCCRSCSTGTSLTRPARLMPVLCLKLRACCSGDVLCCSSPKTAEGDTFSCGNLKKSKSSWNGNKPSILSFLSVSSPSLNPMTWRNCTGKAHQNKLVHERTLSHTLQPVRTTCALTLSFEMNFSLSHTVAGPSQRARVGQNRPTTRLPQHHFNRHLIGVDLLLMPRRAKHNNESTCKVSNQGVVFLAPHVDRNSLRAPTRKHSQSDGGCMQSICMWTLHMGVRIWKFRHDPGNTTSRQRCHLTRRSSEPKLSSLLVLSGHV